MVKFVPDLLEPVGDEATGRSGAVESWPLNVELAYVSHYLGIMGAVRDGSRHHHRIRVHETGVERWGGGAQQGVLVVNTQYQITAITDGASNTFLVGEQSFTANDSGCAGVDPAGATRPVGTPASRPATSCPN